MFIVTVVILVALLTTIHPFLAVNAPVDGEILVVEGWLSRKELQLAVEEYHRGRYRMIVTTGGPINDGTSKTYAVLAAESIRKLGLDPKFVTAVSAPYAPTDKSFTTALAFRKWLINAFGNVKTLNIFTSGVHGRRSRVLYRKMLGPGIEVGVLSVKETRYNPLFWWLSQKGIRKVVRNTAGYVYYTLFIRRQGSIVTP